MDTATIKRSGYVWLIVSGLLALLSPRRAVSFDARLWNCDLENVGDLEPKPWLVRSTRAVGVGLIATGVVGYVLEGRAGRERAESEEIDIVDETTTDVD